MKRFIEINFDWKEEEDLEKMFPLGWGQFDENPVV